MDIVVSQERGRVPVTLLRVKGDVDAASSPQLQTQAEAAIKAGARDLLIDLSGVPYMSSAGLRVLNHLFNLLRGDSPGEADAAMSKGIADGTFKSPHLKLLNPSRRVLEVLKMAGFDMFLEIDRDLQAAIASF